MDLLKGGPSLTPPFRKRVDESDAVARRLLGHAAEISRLATVYEALQDKAASVLRDMAQLVADPQFVTDVDMDKDPLNVHAIACFKALMTLSEAHTCTTQLPPDDATTAATDGHMQDDKAQQRRDAGSPNTENQDNDTDTESKGNDTDTPPPRPQPPTIRLEDDEELAMEWMQRLDHARTKFEEKDGAAAEATHSFAAMSKKKTKGTTRYDAGAKLQELRRETHRAALNRGVELMLAPKVAQLRTLGLCYEALSRIESRTVAMAAACEGPGGATAVATAAPSALAEARGYVADFIVRQRELLAAQAEKQLASDDDYHNNPDVFVHDVESDETNDMPAAAGSADRAQRRGVGISPSPDRPAIAGFLHAKRVPGIKTKPWSRWYFAVHDCALLLWHPAAQDWAVFCGLTGAVCKEASVGDRVNTFTVSFPRLKHLKLSLQAESRKDVEQWISTVTTASRDLSGSLGVHSQPKGHRAAPVFYSADVPRRTLTDARLAGLSDTKDHNAAWVPDSSGTLHLVLVNEIDEDAEPSHRPDSTVVLDADAPVPKFDVGSGDSKRWTVVVDAEALQIDVSRRSNPFGAVGGDDGAGGDKAASDGGMGCVSQPSQSQISASDPLFDDDHFGDALLTSKKKSKPARPPPPVVSTNTPGHE